MLCVMNSNSNLEPASKELERVSCQVREHFAEKTWTGVGTQCQFFFAKLSLQLAMQCTYRVHSETLFDCK